RGRREGNDDRHGRFLVASRKWIATFRRPKQILKSADFSRWSMVCVTLPSFSLTWDFIIY
ncbi:unnamed protein product, partial [Musa hybrid cultivar]